MKIRLIIISLIFLLFFSSCTKDTFSVIDSSLTLKSEYNTSPLYSKREELKIDVSLENEDDESYSFRLLDPSGDLVWEGELEREGGEKYSSSPLAITPSASFPLGEYKLYIYSSSGSSHESTVKLKKDEKILSLNSNLDENVKVTLFERDGSVTEKMEEADWLLLSYLDKYGNSYLVREEL